MKKLLFIIILAALGYGAWKYMEQIGQKTTERQGVTKKSEKALKSMEGQDVNPE